MTFNTYISKGYKWIIDNAIPCVIGIFIVWMLFFDDNSLLVIMKIKNNIQSLSVEKQYYMDLITRDSILLKELKTNDNNLEKFVREQYFMRAADEDVFEIVERP
jgi:hypothetical protein